MAPRVVSLLPSATEALAASSEFEEDDPQLVGRSHECDFPLYVQSRPVLTSSRNNFESCSQMNNAVNASLAAGESLYTVDADLLEKLRPDVIITQDLCNVCSVDLALVQRVCQEFANIPQVVSLNPFSLEDVLEDILKVGHAVGRQHAAEKAVHLLKHRISKASAIGYACASKRSYPLKVAVCEWIEPIFPGGHWTPQLVKLAGAEHPLNPAGFEGRARASAACSNEALMAADCDWIILCPCGLDIETTSREVQAIASQDWWRALRAVKESRVAVVDGSQHFNRPGPRLVEALEWLTGLLNERPDIMPLNFPWRWLHDLV